MPADLASFLVLILERSGYDAPFHLSEECSNANIASPRAIVLTSGVGGLFGWFLQLVVAYTVVDIDDVLESDIGQPWVGDSRVFSTHCRKLCKEPLRRSGWAPVLQISSLVSRKAMLTSELVPGGLPSPSLAPKDHPGHSLADNHLRLLYGPSMHGQCPSECLLDFPRIRPSTNGPSQVAASRVTFAYARDDCFPCSPWIARVNKHTRTPVNAVWLNTIVGILLDLLILGGDLAAGALFSIGAVAAFVAFTIPIFIRVFFVGDRFKKGPWNLGKASYPIGVVACAFVALMVPILMLPSLTGSDLESVLVSPKRERFANHALVLLA